MIKVLRFDQYRSTPWKNGRGTSAQIAIFPEDAVFPGEDFLWRVSTAKITAAGPFSTFAGCDRILAVWQGPGLLLGGQCLTPLVPMKFLGDEPLECALLGGPVLDLGVIYRRGRVTADMKLENLMAGVPRPALALSEGVHFLVCAAGSFDVDGVRASTGDTLRVEGPVLVNLRAVSAGEARVFSHQLAGECLMFEADERLKNREFFLKIAQTRMPFGRYAGTLLVKLPEPYVTWFQRKGFPEGELGQMLAIVYEIKLNRLEYLFDPLLAPPRSI